MSHKQLLILNLKRVLYLLFTFIFLFTGMFFLDDSVILLFVIFTILSFTFLFLWVFSLIPKTNTSKKRKLKNEIKQAMFNQPLTLAEIKELFKWKHLDLIEAPILKILFNEDNTQRCLITKESNAVKLTMQTLKFLSDDEKYWRLDFAQWLPDYDDIRIYEDVEIAIKSSTDLLKNFHEEELKITKQKRITIQIDWKDITLKSDLIPFGSYNTFDVKINNQIIKNVTIHNIEWFDMSCSKAEMSIQADVELNLEKKFKIEILKDNNIIAIGRYYKPKTNLF